MARWRKRKIPFSGSVLFRGAIPPQPHEFAYLEQLGCAIHTLPDCDVAHWSLSVQRPGTGNSMLMCLRDAPRPDRVLFDFDANLTPQEKATIATGESSVSVRVACCGGDVLSDRKEGLSLLRALLGREGVAAVDHVSGRFWSRQALDDELAHDAALDVEAIYCLHAVCAEAGMAPCWMHTHGLAEIGAFDVDILNPTTELHDSPVGMDVFRALAFAILEGKVDSSTPRFQLGWPGGEVRFVPVRAFNRHALGSIRCLRAESDDEHNTAQRAVLCEPVKGWLGRWTRPIVPSEFLSRPVPEGVVFRFSTTASDLMADRARLTCPLLRSLVEEFANCGFRPLVKLGYGVDGGGSDDKEHLWFELNGLNEQKIEATLLSRPHQIARLKEGDRGEHPLDLLSDWVILTPLGSITPRSTQVARYIRQSGPELRQALSERT